MERTPEELSEMEEFIDQRCKEAAAEGFKIAPHVTYADGQCCPIGAVTREERDVIEKTFGWHIDQTDAFMRGFDDDPPPEYRYDPDLFAMGRRFRERALAGEYVKGGGT